LLLSELGVEEALQVFDVGAEEDDCEVTSAGTVKEKQMM
jgi:hypothetical protein